MIRLPPRSTLTDPLSPYPTPFRSSVGPVAEPAAESVPEPDPEPDIIEASEASPLGHDRIELARDYVELGDVDTARGLLQEVAHDGEAAERGEDLRPRRRSEEHTTEIQSLMRTSYAAVCLKNKYTSQ